MKSNSTATGCMPGWSGAPPGCWSCGKTNRSTPVVGDRRTVTGAGSPKGPKNRLGCFRREHDLQLNYVGHAAHWDRVEIDGSLAAKDCTVTYRQSGRKLAVLTIGRDCDSLAAEIELEKTIAAGI
jgi:hypothetical protein